MASTGVKSGQLCSCSDPACVSLNKAQNIGFRQGKEHYEDFHDENRQFVPSEFNSYKPQIYASMNDIIKFVGFKSVNSKQNKPKLAYNLSFVCLC